MCRSPRLLLLALLVPAAALGLWALWIEPASLTVRRHLIPTPRPELAGLRIAVLADLHVGSPFNGLDKLPRIVQRTNDVKADLILLPGDFVIGGVVGGSFVSPEEIALELSKLRARLGVYAVLGNHDWNFDERRTRISLETAGIPVLDDRAIRLDLDGTALWLGGISDLWEGPADVARMLADVHDEAPLIAFAHNPDVFPRCPPRIDLVIAGHTHGGQVLIPFVGRPIVPSKYGGRYAYGLIVERGRSLFVSSGIGTSILPVRFLVPPEISVLELELRR